MGYSVNHLYYKVYIQPTYTVIPNAGMSIYSKYMYKTL
jgi:hypothetical protein